MKFVDKIKELVFIMLIGSICIGSLLGIRAHTLPKIEHDKEINLKAAILEAAGIKYSQEELQKVFDKNIKTHRKNGFIYYENPSGIYIYKFEGRGLWGMIEGVIALKPDLATIDNLRLLAQEETPGLGGRIEEKGFLDQFKGKKVSPKIIAAVRQKAVKENEIDAITGASLTTNALVDIINASVLHFREVK